MIKRQALALVASAVLLASVSVPAQHVAPTRAAGRPSPATDAVTPSATPTVDLGRYAANGIIKAAVVEGSSGTTYIGGHFTQIGLRTGSVAAVKPPDVGAGSLSTGRPEIVGQVVAVFADERAGDPGFFVIGKIRAINGAKVADRPVIRMHLVDEKWVVDGSWQVPDGCATAPETQFPLNSPWIATPKYLIAGGIAGVIGSTTGVTLIERATGMMLNLGAINCTSSPKLHPTIPQLPAIKTCGDEDYCLGVVRSLAYDPTAQRLAVAYDYVVGPSSGTDQWAGVAAYDLRTGGGRSWILDLEAGSPPGPQGLEAEISNVGALPGGFLIRGRFHLDAALTQPDELSRLLSIDASTGAFSQRWNANGEQDLADGSVIGSENGCYTSETWRDLGSVPSGLTGWTDGGLCHYNLSGGELQAAYVETVSVQSSAQDRLPSTYYEADNGVEYLLGSNAAVNLSTGDAVEWHPDPGMATSAPRAASVAAVAGTVIIGGDFTFVRGRPSPGIAAFDSAMTPVPGFTSPLREPTNDEGVLALGLSQGRLLVGGAYILPSGTGSIVAVDAETGAVDPWTPAADVPIVVDAIAVSPAGDFWIGGFADIGTPSSSLQQYASIDDGGGLIDAPSFGCLDAPVIPEFSSQEPLCGLSEWADRTRVRTVHLDASGSLYVAGAFGSIDGVERRGLARIDADGTIDDWDPDLLGALALSGEQGVRDFAPYSLAVLSDRVIVGGLFDYVEWKPDHNGGTTSAVSPLFVFSASSGALVLPDTLDRLPWFPRAESWATAYDIAHTDAGLFVALGDEGLGIFDATTFQMDEVASDPFLNHNWWTRDPDKGVFTLALPGPESTTSGLAASSPERLVIAGAFPRWGNRAAGSILRALIAADTKVPTATSPRAAPRVGVGITGKSLSTRLTWSGADLGGSGVRRYELAMSRNGGSYATVSTGLLRPAANVVLVRGDSYRFRVRAVDFAGNKGAWTYGSTFSTALVQQTSSSVTFSRDWKTLKDARYSGGSTRVRSIRGAAARYRFTGRAVGLVSTLGATRGKARIYVDDHYVATIDLKASATTYRSVVWSKSWTSRGTHTVRVVVVGTSGRPRIDVDAFAVIR